MNRLALPAQIFDSGHRLAGRYVAKLLPVVGLQNMLMKRGRLEQWSSGIYRRAGFVIIPPSLRGRSSVVERHVANVNVEGSNPFARFL